MTGVLIDPIPLMIVGGFLISASVGAWWFNRKKSD